LPAAAPRAFRLFIGVLLLAFLPALLRGLFFGQGFSFSFGQGLVRLLPEGEGELIELRLS
jgi:hypothetical protein